MESLVSVGRLSLLWLDGSALMLTSGFPCGAAINGYVFGNLPEIQLCRNRAVAWHLFGMGNEEDVHSVFFQGNTLLERSHRTDTVSLFPASFVTAQMVPRADGKWLLSCQVNDHLHGRPTDL